MSLAVKPLSDALGVEIQGVDLESGLDQATFEQVQKAWEENLILLFRDQHLSAEGQLRFAELFGQLEEVRSRPSYASEKVMFVSNVPVEGKEGVLPTGEMQFHFDQCYYELPAKATTLYAIDIPTDGGNTLFVNAQKAYRALPTEIKGQIEPLKALNVYDYDSNPTTRAREVNPEAPQFAHPVVVVHPATGRRSLYVNRLMTHHLIGVPSEEGEQLLAFLLDHLEKDDFIYEHSWRPGDLIMWDNLSTLHARKDFDPNQKRTLRRLAIRGQRPVGVSKG